jgi:hypothetical protein
MCRKYSNNAPIVKHMLFQVSCVFRGYKQSIFEKIIRVRSSSRDPAFCPTFLFHAALVLESQRQVSSQPVAKIAEPH